ncbi:hypothetical protein WME91_31715 [Sorangium sp. So ce269]
MPDRSSSKLLRALLPLLAATSCDGCPSSKPYTPYTLGSATPSGSPPPLSGVAPGAADAGPEAGAPDAAAPPRFAVVPSVPAPAGGKQWPLEGGAVVAAPTGRTFETGLLLDADGDGARDLVVWARSPDGLRGELLLAPAARPQALRTLTALPGDLAAQGCTPRVALNQIGPSALAFDFAPQCGADRRAASAGATRWLAVIRLPGSATGAGAPPELALELRLRTPPPEEALSAALEVADPDADGRDDLLVTLGLSGALRPFPAPSPSPAPGGAAAEVRAPLIFLDRPAGLSRDAAQPGETLRALAASLLRDARGKATAPAVAAAAQRLRRLNAVLCADAAGGGALAGRDAARAGEALVWTGAGPVRCGEPGLAAAIDNAEAVAASTRGAPLAAIAALDHGAEPRTKDADKLLAKLAPPAAATAVYRTAAAPQPAGPGAFGPLAFEASGALLVRTAQGVVRVDPATSTESATDVPPWPAAIHAGPAQLVAVERRCDAPTLLALFRSSPDAVGEMEVPLPLLRSQGPRARAASPERCAGTERLPFSPLAASEGGFDIALGAALVSIDLRAAAPASSALSFPLTTPAPQGAARSPDGATLAVPAAGGLLVATAGGPARLWSGGDLAQGTACAPANGGARVACVVGAAAVIFEAK